MPGNALIRELAEELGILVTVPCLRPVAFAESSEAASSSAIVILLYTASDWSGDPAPLEAGAEIGWFTPAEIALLDRPPLDVALCGVMFGKAGFAPR